MPGIPFRRTRGIAPMLALTALCLCAADAAADVQPVAVSSGLQAHATGVFVNAGGDVLTAHHAVADCESLFVIKDGRVVRAQVLAQDETLDLAVLATTLAPYLSATFEARADVRAGRQGAFAESYNVLQRMPDRARTVFNAMIVPGGEELSLLSSVRPGASGSPVLGGEGLVLGMVVERVAVDGRPSGKVALSRARAAGTSAATRVKAVPAGRIKAFLREHGVPYAESDVPQLGPMQAQAPRAATLSVGVICG